MDPYLEAHWRDVHASLVIYIRDALQDQLPAELRARVEERVVLERPEGIGNGLFPAVQAVEYFPNAETNPVSSPSEVGFVGSLLVEAGPEPLTEGFLQVIDTGSGNRVVTVIEVLSPTNKLPGEGLTQYRRKQEDICLSDTCLVEIDLLRIGKHVLAVALAKIPTACRTPYMVCVRKPWLPGKATLYPMPLSQRLPTIKVPLRETDAEVPLDLQVLIDLCYKRGRYEGDLNYAVDPEPPLTGTDAEWADERLRSLGLRPPPSIVKPKRRRKGSE
jgi:hypothetical protein